jgi:hypothetical protein
MNCILNKLHISREEDEVLLMEEVFMGIFYFFNYFCVDLCTREEENVNAIEDDYKYQRDEQKKFE